MVSNYVQHMDWAFDNSDDFSVQGLRWSASHVLKVQRGKLGISGTWDVALAFVLRRHFLCILKCAIEVKIAKITYISPEFTQPRQSTIFGVFAL